MTANLTPHEPRARRRWLRAAPLATLQEELGDLTSNLLAEIGDVWPLSRLTPPLDVSETDAAIEVRMDLPGVNAEEIDIKLTDNLLTVSGERNEEKEEKGRKFHRVERRQGCFSRSVTLPSPVDDGTVDAQFRDGVLTISMSKSDDARARKIKVHT